MAITQFSGASRFLSNFYPSPFAFGGREWPTVEHRYQAMKCQMWDDAERIRKASSPSEAKKLGGKVVMWDDWDEARKGVMLFCLRLKFAPGSALAARLVATGSHQLIEGNRWHDNYWGNCQCYSCSTARGENMLGRLLMQVRAELAQR